MRGVPIKTIARDLRVSKNTVRKVVRGDETSYSYERKIQPMPKLGPWVDEFERQLKANEKKARRDRLSLLRIHEDLASLGYEGGYDAVRRYARVWRRRHLAPIGDFSARSLHAFVAGTSAPGARVITDGWSGYPGLPDHDHQPKVVGATPAHLVLIWIHRVFSNLKRWALGTFHGLRRAHLRRYLDEFVFRWNRRRHTATAFDTLLGIGARLRPADYRDIVGQRV